MRGIRYNEEAIELCRRLYCKYGGENHPAIEREMQRSYPGWKKSNLADRGRVGNGHEQLGWITRYGFDRSLKLHLQKLVESVNDDEQDLYLGIKTVRQALQKKNIGANPTKDEMYAYRDFCKLEIEARRNLDLSRDNFETFVAGYERLVDWLMSLDKTAAKALAAHAEKLTEMAQAHYGKSESSFDNRTDD